MTLLTVLPRLRTNNLKGLGATLTVHRKTPRVNRAVANVAAALVRTPFGRFLLNALPDRLIYQRCYVAR
jgi:hypothetical protein